MREVAISPEACQGINQAFEYYAEKVGDIDLANRFLNNLFQLFEQLATFPGIGSPFESDHPKLQDIRVSSVKKFESYRVFYRQTEHSINIRYIHHSSKDPDRILG